MKPDNPVDDAGKTGARHLPTLASVLASALVLLAVVAAFTHEGRAFSWPDVLLPLSLAVFIFGWLQMVWSQCAGPLARVMAIAAGVAGAHVALWFPFLLLSYLGGHGAGSFDYSVPAALFTSLVVGWYTLGDNLWVSLGLIGLGVLLHFALTRQRSI